MSEGANQPRRRARTSSFFVSWHRQNTPGRSHGRLTSLALCLALISKGWQQAPRDWMDAILTNHSPTTATTRPDPDRGGHAAARTPCPAVSPSSVRSTMFNRRVARCPTAAQHSIIDHHRQHRANNQLPTPVVMARPSPTSPAFSLPPAASPASIRPAAVRCCTQ